MIYKFMLIFIFLMNLFQIFMFWDTIRVFFFKLRSRLFCKKLFNKKNFTKVVVRSTR